MRTVLVPFFVVVLAGCGVSTAKVSEGDDGVAELVEGEAELSSGTYTYVTVRRDYRRCASPYCGGYWVKDVNVANAAEQYVSAITYVNGSISPLGRQQLAEAADGELVLRARLGALDSRTRTRKLVVRSAWRGLPGKTLASTDRLYAVDRLVTACLPGTSCPSLEAVELNGPRTVKYAQRLNVATAADGQLSRDWLEAQALDGETLTAGRFLTSRKHPAPAVTELDASNVYVKLAAQWSCPVFRLARCPNEGTWTYKYDSSGCIVPDRCVEGGACIALAPQPCANGYRALNFAAAPFACSAQVCEPEFIDVIR